MGETPHRANAEEELTLTVDNRGRVILPKEVRDRLGIEPHDEVPARLVGSVLELKPSSKLGLAGTEREEWTDSTRTDAGETLFGPTDAERR